MTTKIRDLLTKLEQLRKLQRNYFKSASSVQKASILRDMKPLEPLVDELASEVKALLDAEQLRMF